MLESSLKGIGQPHIGAKHCFTVVFRVGNCPELIAMNYFIAITLNIKVQSSHLSKSFEVRLSDKTTTNNVGLEWISSPVRLFAQHFEFQGWPTLLKINSIWNSNLAVQPLPSLSLSFQVKDSESNTLRCPGRIWLGK